MNEVISTASILVVLTQLSSIYLDCVNLVLHHHFNLGSHLFDHLKAIHSLDCSAVRLEFLQKVELALINDYIFFDRIFKISP